jgi:hypothetical protein
VLPKRERERERERNLELRGVTLAEHLSSMHEVLGSALTLKKRLFEFIVKKTFPSKKKKS